MRLWYDSGIHVTHALLYIRTTTMNKSKGQNILFGFYTAGRDMEKI